MDKSIFQKRRSMKPKGIYLFSIFLTIPFITSLVAWSNHSLGTYVSLKEMPEVKTAAPVEVESLESFLQKEKNNLANLLREEEEFAQKNIQSYPMRPDFIAFHPGDDTDIVVRFLNSIRVNPKIKLGYYLQVLPGSTSKLPALTPKNVTILTKDEWITRYKFAQLKPGDKVSALDVVSTAADEPDYGLDLDLYEDNESEFGKKYGFGLQPFGNAAIEYATQAPFHIGYYHESWIVYLFAGFLNRTLPEYRLSQFLALSKFAFKSGHPYWGYRFLGWGLHYIEDLTQPYHCSVLPGNSPLGMIWINTLAVFGFDGLKKEAIQRISERHEAIENYHYAILVNALKEKKENHPFIQSLMKLDKDVTYGNYSHPYIRNVIAKESKERSDRIDYLLGNAKEILNFQRDAEFNLDSIPNDEYTKELNRSIEDLMNSFGSHSRNYVRNALQK